MICRLADLFCFSVSLQVDSVPSDDGLEAFKSLTGKIGQGYVSVRSKSPTQVVSICIMYRGLMVIYHMIDETCALCDLAPVGVMSWRIGPQVPG
jgi:hypothetical protein